MLFSKKISLFLKIFIALALLISVSSCYQMHVKTEIKENNSVFRELKFKMSKEKMEQLESMGESMGADEMEPEEEVEEEDTEVDMSKECYEALQWDIEEKEDDEYITYISSKTFDSVEDMVEGMKMIQECDEEEEMEEDTEDEEELEISINYTTEGDFLVYREKGISGFDGMGGEGSEGGNEEMEEGMKQMMKGMMAGFEYTFELTMPNKIEDSNATEVDGKTAKWVYTLDDLLNDKSFEAYAKCKK